MMTAYSLINDKTHDLEYAILTFPYKSLIVPNETMTLAYEWGPPRCMIYL